MKKLFAIALMTLICLSVFDNSLYSQDDSRQERRQERQAQQQAINAKLAASVKGKNFVFIATEIVSTINPNVQNIQLNSGLWGVWVTPAQFKAYLPIYGADVNDVFPTLSSTLDYFTGDYNITTQPNPRGGTIVNITSTDMWTLNSYSYTIYVTSSGAMSYMTIGSTFTNTVSFRGNVESL